MKNNIFEIIENYEIKTINLLFFKNIKKEINDLESISISSDFFNQDFFNKKIIIKDDGDFIFAKDNEINIEKYESNDIFNLNENIYFIDLSSSRISLSIFLDNIKTHNLYSKFLSEEKNYLFNKVKISFDIKTCNSLANQKIDDSLVYDFCYEILEHSSKIDSKFFQKYKISSFYIKNNSEYQKKIFFHLDFLKNEKFDDNLIFFLNSILIIKKIIINISKNFGFYIIDEKNNLFESIICDLSLEKENEIFNFAPECEPIIFIEKIINLYL
jgi:hypothetical protein